MDCHECLWPGGGSGRNNPAYVLVLVCAAVPEAGWGWLLTPGLHLPRASPSSS